MGLPEKGFRPWMRILRCVPSLVLALALPKLPGARPYCDDENETILASVISGGSEPKGIGVDKTSDA